MTSVVIPGLDLVPSLPSRVVTVDLVDMTEGVAVAGAKIDFFLPADLHVPADDKILQAGRVTLTLNASGHGEIRLPAYTDTVRPADWVIGVKKHWAPHPYYIRVPAGSTKISLADIDAVQTLPQGVVDWMITGAAVTVTEGAAWNATAQIIAGILQLGFTVPPGGDAYWRGTTPLTGSEVLENLDPAAYLVPSGTVAAALGMPAGTNGVVWLSRISSTGRLAFYQTDHGVYRAYHRSTGWQGWVRIDPDLSPRLDAVDDVIASSRVTNLVADPHPTAPANTYTTTNIRTLSAPAPNWARAIATGAGAAWVIPSLQNGDMLSQRLDVVEGQQIAFSAELRAMPDQDISATVFLRGFLNGASLGTVLTTGQHTMTAHEVRRYTLSEVVPAGVDQVELVITFRTRGQTYPTDGHFLYFRKVGLYVGTAPTNVIVTTGDDPFSYWLGQPNRSGSVTMTPRTSAQSEVRRDVIVDAGLRRRGGIIGTGGKPVIALRFDHHFAQFNSKIMPLLRQYRLPWGQMVNIGRFGTGNDTLSVAQVRDLCYTSGGELWNHGLSHASMPNKEAADREITQGLADLKAAFPQLWIDGWAPPGQPDMMGMEGYDTPEKIWDTYPGQLIMRQHAFVRARFPGAYHRLAGHNLVGVTHYTIDLFDDTHLNAVIRGAVASRAGLTLMLHPNYMDEPGYITTAQFEATLAFIAQLRDQGDLIVLTPTAILLADIGRDDRWSLVTGEAAAPGTLTAPLSHTVSTRSASAQYGVPHEATVTVTATAATQAVLSVQVTHPGGVVDQNHTVTLASGESQTLRVLVTPPLDTTETKLTIDGELTHDGIKYWAV